MAGKKKEQPPVVKEALKTPYVKRMTKKGGARLVWRQSQVELSGRQEWQP